ncbi:MAG: EAL domain-containing protein [Oscillospiraceae bacterium]
MSRFSFKDFVKQYFYKIAIAIFAVVFLIVGILCFQYYHRLQSTIATESKGYLKEISNQLSVNVNKTINDNFSILGTISTVLDSHSFNSYESVQPIILKQQRYWNFQNILLVDKDGISYDAFGKTSMLGADNSLRITLVDKKASMSTSHMVNGIECVVFAIPLTDLTVGNIQMSALIATYDLRTFDRILSMTAFDGKGYAHIIRQDGTFVIRSSSQAAAKTGYNILNSLSASDLGNEKALAKLRGDFSKGLSGQVDLTIDNEIVYMVYTPLETQQWYLLTFVSMNVVNAKSDLLLKLTLLLCGFITFSFAVLFTYLLVTSYHHKRSLEIIAYVDSVTGGNTIDRFYECGKKLLCSHTKTNYALIYTNIEKFKVMNEQFGHKACDVILRGLEHGISSNLNECEVVGRIFADNFCVLAEYSDVSSLIARFDCWYDECVSYIEKTGSVLLPLNLEFGIFVIGSDTAVPLPHMVDRAKLALREATRVLHGKMHYAVYDDCVRSQLLREKQLEDEMYMALERREFEVYLQPKYTTKDERVFGAEALVRWNSSFEGMIFPDEFIPLFERNGFIIQLDLFVFDKVCRTIRSWLDNGLVPVKISINCSRVHLKAPDFLKHYRTVFDKYEIPPRYIEIELTENVVFEDVEYLTEIIDNIHKAGFSCSMDDFGSGYSSLNLIRDIPVDVLKLDKVFFAYGTGDAKRTESVVGSIISMARALSMETVAEGVEDRSQVEMLKRLGCDYMQGFYYAKPMPISDFEKLTFGK